MKRKILIVPMSVILILSLTGCASGAGGPGPRTWIDAPLDGSTVELAPVVIRSHAASDGGTAQAVLMVNGAQVRVDQAGDSASPLIEFAQTWTPDEPGVYLIQIISTDHAGNEGRSNTVRIQVGETVATNTVTPEALVALTPTATGIAEPTFTFNAGANCREGDSTAYDVVTAFPEGEQVRIDGRNADSSWFRVLIPGGGSCWVSTSTGTPSGPYDAVQVVLPPPLPATDTPVPAQPPAAPGNLHISGEVCTSEEFSVTLEWGDVSGEDGYRVYRDGLVIATLNPNASSFTDEPPDYNAHTYGLEAFNGSGVSARPTVQEDGCLF